MLMRMVLLGGAPRLVLSLFTFSCRDASPVGDPDLERLKSWTRGSFLFRELTGDR